MSEIKNNVVQAEEPAERKSYREATQPIFDELERKRLRDIFAAGAINGVLNGFAHQGYSIDTDHISNMAAQAAYRIADYMLVVREKGKA